jgi:cytochrome c biogenesis factor
MLYNICRRLVGADKIPLLGFSGVFMASSSDTDTSFEPNNSCNKVLRLLFVVTIFCLLLWIFLLFLKTHFHIFVCSRTEGSGISFPASD